VSDSPLLKVSLHMNLSLHYLVFLSHCVCKFSFQWLLLLVWRSCYRICIWQHFCEVFLSATILKCHYNLFPVNSFYTTSVHRAHELLKQRTSSLPQTNLLEAKIKIHSVAANRQHCIQWWQWRNLFLPYLWQLFSAMMWGKLWEMFVIVTSPS